MRIPPVSPKPARLFSWAFLSAGMALATPAQAQRISNFTLQPVAGSPLKQLAGLSATGLTAGADQIVEDSPDLIRWQPVSPVLRPGTTLAWSHVQYDLANGSADLFTSGSWNWSKRRFYRIRKLPPGNPAPTITGTPVAPVGRLIQLQPKGHYRVTTAAGWLIWMQGTTLTITNPGGTVSYDLWGSGPGPGTGHENFNGKHVKETQGGPRTLLLPDGTIVTAGFSSAAGTNSIASFSIYDGDQSHRLKTTPDSAGNPNTVIMSVLLRRAGEAQEADGETSRIIDAPEGGYWENIYKQTVSDGQALSQESVPLARTGGPANPNMVNDFYTDP